MSGNDAQSLNDEATSAGARGRVLRDGGLGDERTLGGGASGQDTTLGDLEIVDLEARYHVEGTLGEGGMGAVLLATDTRLGRKVAIKRILGEAAENRLAVSRFLTEAKAIAALNHPNIVQIYDSGRAKDGPFLIMEYVDGGTLLDRCLIGALPLDEAIDLACHLCDGLAKAHDAGIIHRDIKPANVLLTKDGTPKLADFGLAKAESGDHRQTTTGAVLGTPDFMPPEQRRDASEVDARSDLWSLAATVYQMVTGRSPKVIRLDDIHPALRGVLAKALEDRKDARYQSVGEFRAVLKSIATGGQASGGHLVEGQCLNCGAHNDRNRRFCGRCGSSFDVACVECGSTMKAWEDVCDSCGARQTQIFAARRESLAAMKAEAEVRLSDFAFDDAIALASRIRDEPHPSLRDLAAWAADFMNEVEECRRASTDQANAAVTRALECEEDHEYEVAIAALEGIPAQLRRTVFPGMSESAADVAERVRATLSEVRTLRQRLDSASASDTDGLLEDLERLCVLQPRDDALQLILRKQREAERSRRAVVEAERARIAAIEDVAARVVAMTRTQAISRCAQHLSRGEESEVFGIARSVDPDERDEELCQIVRNCERVILEQVRVADAVRLALSCDRYTEAFHRRLDSCGTSGPVREVARVNDVLENMATEEHEALLAIPRLLTTLESELTTERYSEARLFATLTCAGVAALGIGVLSLLLSRGEVSSRAGFVIAAEVTASCAAAVLVARAAISWLQRRRRSHAIAKFEAESGSAASHAVAWWATWRTLVRGASLPRELLATLIADERSASWWPPSTTVAMGDLSKERLSSSLYPRLASLSPRLTRDLLSHGLSIHAPMLQSLDGQLLELLRSSDPSPLPIDLSGIATISNAEAEALALISRPLVLDGLILLEMPVAERLADRQGSLSLAGLEDLDPSAASELCRIRGDICLDGLRRIDAPLARAIAGRQGGGLAAYRLSLSGLRGLDADSAAGLAGCSRGVLLLDGLEEISSQVLASFAGYRGILSFRGVDTLTSPLLEALSALTACSGVRFDGVKYIDARTAAVLSTFTAVPLSLRGLAPMSVGVAGALASNPLLLLPERPWPCDVVAEPVEDAPDITRRLAARVPSRFLCL